MTLSAKLQRCHGRGLSEGAYRCGKSAPTGRTFSLAVRALPSTTAVVFPAVQVFEKPPCTPSKLFPGDGCDACDGCLGI